MVDTEDKDKGFTYSLKESFETVKKKAQAEGIVNQGVDILLYVLVLIGIILALFLRIELGATLVGVAIGFAFAPELLLFFKGYKGWINVEGLGKGIILTGTLVFLLIALPGGVIAAVIAMLIRAMIPAKHLK